MQVGDYRVEIIPDTEFHLDGGAMFGVVPRKLWARECPPDDDNRIRMNMNCVFIDTGTDKILIETGIGEKWTAKQTSMYGIERARPDVRAAIWIPQDHVHTALVGGLPARQHAHTVATREQLPRQCVTEKP